MVGEGKKDANESISVLHCETLPFRQLGFQTGSAGEWRQNGGESNIFANSGQTLYRMTGEWRCKTTTLSGSMLVLGAGRDHPVAQCKSLTGRKLWAKSQRK
jgi:hypothetical protein